MTPERWEEIEKLYNQALEISEDHRAAFLCEACAGDDVLRQDVEGLLAERRHTASFLEKPALQRMAAAFAATAAPSWIGRQIGNYQFVSLAGAGSMGEVYRAHDTKLKREVAIKVLPDALSSDPDRVSRLQREAELLASLNHPNIAAIYDFEETDRSRFLILEFVEGETLQERLKRGPIPLDEALQIAAQLAEGIAAAHERGIIHRDLKPANIKLTPEGKVKVLDFGLAKVFAGERDANLLNSPTKAPASMPGTILGTAAYMSPEQAQGKPADKRADIWAFGVVFYEMLTGRRLFKDDNFADTVAAVLTKEPEWDRVPARVRTLLRRCLVKDPQRRLRDIGDAMALVDTVDTMLELIPSARPRLAWGAAILFLGFSLLSVIYFRKTPLPPEEPTRFQISPPDKLHFAPTDTFALSPDGRRLVYWVRDADMLARLWLRDLKESEPRLLPDTESTAGVTGPPFWSPDSRFVVFDSGGKLRQVDVTGGPVQVISNLSNPAWGGSWNKNNVIIIGNGNRGIRRVSAAGGDPAALTVLDLSRKEIAHLTPYFLPDGRHFLYHRLSNIPQNSGIYLGSIDAKPDEQSSKQLVAAQAGPVYVPSRGANAGQLLFLRDTTLLAQTFDTKKLELTGEPVSVAEQVGDTNGSMALFSASTNGVLIYKASGQDLQLTLYDREGNIIGTVGEPARYNSLDLSPDGTRVIVSKTDPRSANQDLYLLDLLGKTKPERFTSDPASDRMPAWSPDGKHIAFLSDRSGVSGLYQKASSGPVSEERLRELGSRAFLSDWSPDGLFLVYAIEGGPPSGADLWLLPLNGAREPIPFARNKFRENWAHFSPDSRWIAYQWNESGRGQIYVQPFSASPDAGTSATADTWKVSKDGGTMPRWRRDGRELYFLGSDAKVMAVEISANPMFHHGPPTPLFQVPVSFLTTGTQGINLLGDVTADGERFLFAIPVSPREELAVVLNWRAELKK